MAAKKIRLKILINKERSRVVFAESDEDFVDILLSFLTLPMGTIIRTLGKDSTVGCMDTLYESVESIDVQYLLSKACKTMLLFPRYASEDWCECLAHNIEDPTNNCYYMCSNWDCAFNKNCLRSTVKNVRCRCGNQMDQEIQQPKNRDGGEGKGVFVKEGVRYLISDDLHIMPISITSTLALLKLGAEENASLEERTVNVGEDEVLYLLKRALLSNRPLTDAFLPDGEIVDAVKLETTDMSQYQEATGTSSNSKTTSVKLLLSKSNNKVVCAEAQADLIDLLFSFLTFPLGSIIKFFDGNSNMGCVDHLYKSASDLSISKHIKSEECKAMLLSPKLVPHFGCDNQLLDIKEGVASERIIPKCGDCFLNTTDWSFEYCPHGLGKTTISYVNPKLNGAETAAGGGFVEGMQVFMVTDDLGVKPFSPVSILDGLDVPITDLDDRIISVGKKEVLTLLKASLLSKTALSHAFAKSLVRKPERN